MKTRRWLRVLLWVLICGTMLTIFLMSSQNGEVSATSSGRLVTMISHNVYPNIDEMAEQERMDKLSDLDLIIRKTAHFCEYAMLAFWISLLMIIYGKRERLYFSWIITTLYAASDEIHQLFVSERSAQLLDVLIDSAGALTAVLFLFLILRLKSKWSS